MSEDGVRMLEGQRACWGKAGSGCVVGAWWGGCFFSGCKDSHEEPRVGRHVLCKSSRRDLLQNNLTGLLRNAKVMADKDRLRVVQVKEG